MCLMEKVRWKITKAAGYQVRYLPLSLYKFIPLQ